MGSRVNLITGFLHAKFQIATFFILDLGLGKGQTDKRTDRQMTAIKCIMTSLWWRGIKHVMLINSPISEEPFT